jgi:hypothetical protein
MLVCIRLIYTQLFLGQIIAQLRTSAPRSDSYRLLQVVSSDDLNRPLYTMILLMMSTV